MSNTYSLPARVPLPRYEVHAPELIARHTAANDAREVAITNLFKTMFPTAITHGEGRVRFNAKDDWPRVDVTWTDTGFGWRDTRYLQLTFQTGYRRHNKTMRRLALTKAEGAQLIDKAKADAVGAEFTQLAAEYATQQANMARWAADSKAVRVAAFAALRPQIESLGLTFFDANAEGGTICLGAGEWPRVMVKGDACTLHLRSYDNGYEVSALVLREMADAFRHNEALMGA